MNGGGAFAGTACAVGQEVRSCIRVHVCMCRCMRARGIPIWVEIPADWKMPILAKIIREPKVETQMFSTRPKLQFGEFWPTLDLQGETGDVETMTHVGKMWLECRLIPLAGKPARLKRQHMSTICADVVTGDRTANTG